ncbi:unnamed protein product [Malus baccata var. baccata]
MEHKHKLVAAESSQARGACPNHIIDRLSNLPDEVAHQMLSFLNFKELIRVGSVSKRCRELFLSTPSLVICSPDSGNKQKHLNLLDSFDRFLLHRGDSKIQRLSVSWCISSGLANKIFRMITWIHIAARCNVEVLDFALNGKHIPGTLELPACIFLCGSLRSLLVHMDTILKAPSFACSSNLQCLTLKSVTMDEGFCKWISSSCKCIKKLQLSYVSIENITIESSSLESFSLVGSSLRGVHLCHLNISCEKLVDIHIEFYKFDSSSKSMNIFAPNLKYLTWIGSILNYHNLGKITCLEKAEIFLKRKKDDYDFDKIFEVLCSIRKVKALILSEDTTQALFREGSMQLQFDDISYLSLHAGGVFDDLVPAMVSLLRGMPNLKTLHINSYPRFFGSKSCKFNRKYWKSQNLDFVHRLEEVKIELSNGYNGVEFARYILEHAQNLKKMVIHYPPQQSYVERRLSKSKMISTTSIDYQKRDLHKLQNWSESGTYYRYMIRGKSA